MLFARFYLVINPVDLQAEMQGTHLNQERLISFLMHWSFGVVFSNIAFGLVLSHKDKKSSAKTFAPEK